MTTRDFAAFKLQGFDNCVPIQLFRDNQLDFWDIVAPPFKRSLCVVSISSQTTVPVPEFYIATIGQDEEGDTYDLEYYQLPVLRS